MIGQRHNRMPSSSDALVFLICAEWNRGTSSHHFRGIAEELARRGHRIVFVANRPRRELEGWQSNPKAYVWPVHYNHTSVWTALTKNLPFGYRLLRTHRPDCVLVGTGPIDVVLPAAWIGVRTRIIWRRTMVEQRVVDRYAGRTVKHRLAREKNRVILERATHIIGNSQATSEEVQHVFGIRKEKCHVFYNTIVDPVRRYDLKSVTPAPRKIVCASRMFRSKGQDVLLRAVALLVDDIPELEVEFLGDGPERSAYEQVALDLGISSRVRFRGAVPHRDVCRKMREAAVVVVPSRAEAFGFVNIEALAVGTPLIASAAGGIREIVDDGIEGFLVPPDNHLELAGAIRRVLTDHDLRLEMSDRARRRFAEFDFERSIPKQAERLERFVYGAKMAAQT